MEMRLLQYIKKRNGVSIGSPRSLRNNLYRSLGARNFSTFWRYWNPIFGYYLGKFIFKPLNRIFKVEVALLFTFIFSGIIHDAVTSILRGKTSFFFSIWFFIMGIAVILSRLVKHDFYKLLWVKRATINLSIISICLIITIAINHYLRVGF